VKHPTICKNNKNKQDVIIIYKKGTRKWKKETPNFTFLGVKLDRNFITAAMMVQIECRKLLQIERRKKFVFYLMRCSKAYLKLAFC
jgi:hypothetical protein